MISSRPLFLPECPRCGGHRAVKNGFMHRRQRYKCKDCGYNFTLTPRRGHEPQVVALAVWLALCGVPQRQIARLMGVSPVAVFKWVKRCAPLYGDHGQPGQKRGAQPGVMKVFLVAAGKAATFPATGLPSPGYPRLIIAAEHPSFPAGAGGAMEFR